MGLLVFLPIWYSCEFGLMRKRRAEQSGTHCQVIIFLSLWFCFDFYKCKHKGTIVQEKRREIFPATSRRFLRKAAAFCGQAESRRFACKVKILTGAFSCC